MPAMKKLPDAEFLIMKAAWQLEPPVTSGSLLAVINGEDGKSWKPQSLHTLLGRLVEKGFLATTKNGKERCFFPLVSREDYLQFETQSFIKQYHEDSFLNLVNAAYQGDSLTNADIDDLVRWADAQRDKR